MSRRLPSLEACDTALEAAEHRVKRLRSWPATVDVFSHSGFHKWLVEVAHWLNKGYVIGEDSVRECRPDQQHVRLFGPRL